MIFSAFRSRGQKLTSKSTNLAKKRKPKAEIEPRMKIYTSKDQARMISICIKMGGSLLSTIVLYYIACKLGEKSEENRIMIERFYGKLLGLNVIKLTCLKYMMF